MDEGFAVGEGVRMHREGRRFGLDPPTGFGLL